MSVAASTNTMNVTREVLTSNGDSYSKMPTDQADLQQLSAFSKAWRDLKKESEEISAILREKRKRMTAVEEVILRIMKKNEIGALDLKSSGGRLLYKSQTKKGPLPQKDLARLLAEHLKSEDEATKALQYISENRGTKVKESLLFEKNE